MPDEFQEQDEAVVNKALDILSSRFEAAQVFICHQEGDKTIGGSFGRGNWYSRYGIVTEWFENGGFLDVGGGEEEDEPS